MLLALFLAIAPPDAVYFNGKIVTMWRDKAVVEAMAVTGANFSALGTTREVLATAGPETRRIDLKGLTVTPGLIDSHTHPISSALSEQTDPIPVWNTIKDVQDYIREQSAKTPPGRPAIALKVYSTRLAERRYPTRYELDAVAPGRPAMTDNGYASVLNSVLLKQLNITRDTPQPANGKIIKDAKGEPTGLVLGASHLLGPLRRAKPATPADNEWALAAMHKAYNKAGLTSVIDRGQGPEGFRAYQALERRNELTVRTNVTYLLSSGQATPEQLRQEIERIPFTTGYGDDWVRAGPIKVVLDGGILIGTAFLREPYGENTGIYGYKDPDYRGVQAVTKENLFEMARTAVKMGWQMTAHAAGGGAIDLLLDAYEEADRIASIAGRRFTVTHGNFPDARAIERAKKLGVVFDVQPAWHHFDGPALKDVFGPARTAYFIPLRSLFDAGIVVAGGSDHMIRFDSRAAINPYHPFFGMWMSITRRTADGATLEARQGVTREEALKMWTWNAAYLSFDEKKKGSIEVGKLADFTVISKDYLTCPVDEIRDIEAVATIVGGKTVHGRVPSN